MVMSHKQTTVKGDVLVDVGIAPLVEALNSFPPIETVDSCEGYGSEDAYVYFRYAGSAQETAGFLGDLAQSLSSLNSCCEIRFRMEWIGQDDKPLAKVMARREYVGPLADALVELASRHKSPSVDGTLHTEPHNSRGCRSHQQTQTPCDGTPPCVA